MTAPVQQGPWPQYSVTDPMSRYMPAPPRPRPPTSVAAAGWLMYTGAAFTLLNTLLLLAIIGKVKTDFIATHPAVPANMAKSFAAAASAEVLVGGLVITGLWLWLASAGKHGHGWVRTVGTVLFGMSTYLELVMIRVPAIGGARGIGVVIWLIGLFTVILLWQRSSSEYFSARR